MSRRFWNMAFFSLAWGFLALLPWPANSAHAAERRAHANTSTTDAVDLFAAIEAGQISVKVIPKDETRVRLQLNNSAGRPLTVRIPAAIAAVPVLGQNFGAFNNGANPFAGGNGLLGPNPGAAGGGRNQALGVGGGNGLGMGPGMGPGINAPQPGFNKGFRGGLFQIPEGRVTKIDLPAVCLEHGKRSPNHRIPYELRPLEQLTSDLEVTALVAALNDSRVDREIVQIAAWRVTSGWTWEQMSQMTVRRPWGAVEPKFAPSSLAAAKKLTEQLNPVSAEKSLGRTVAR